MIKQSILKPMRQPSLKSQIGSLADRGLLVGWREWVVMPGLKIDRIKTKIDTGARSCALHAVDIRPDKRAEGMWVTFTVEPHAGGAKDRQHVTCQAPVKDLRAVKSSTGSIENRYVISTPVRVGNKQFAVDVTLTNRADMGFEMLFGRSALKAGGLLVHPSKSFLQNLI